MPNGTALPAADAARLPIVVGGKHKTSYGIRVGSAADIDGPLFSRMTALAVTTAKAGNPYDG